MSHWQHSSLHFVLYAAAGGPIIVHAAHFSFPEETTLMQA